ncbi:MAG: PEP/pyruvate-binding domain-containing protein [Pseudomonadota bacterium]
MKQDAAPLIFDPVKTALAPRAGGKALSLERLLKEGFNPPAFVALLPEAFTKSGLRSAQKEALAKALEPLGDGPFAVRSSGLQEDGVDHSHAGQFLSVLNVKKADVAKAALKVWKSGSAASVTEYRKTHGLNETDTAPAVIVQRMIAARAAGVAFSADPVSGLRDRVVISAIEGLGERLVSGEEDGETWEVDHARKAILSRPSYDTGNVLSEADVLAVADLAKAAEKAFGSPQDIEWAFDQDGLHILQARPITTDLKEPANADDQVLIFDNSNIVESYPGLVSPLTYSFARYAYARVYRAFVAMVGVRQSVIAENAVVFDNMLSRLDGRVYYNLVNWYRALALLPGFSINRQNMETMMGVSEPLPEAITATIGPPPAKGLGKIKAYAGMGRAALGLLYQAIRLPRTVKAFNDRLNEAIGPSALSLSDAGLSDLGRDYRRIEAMLLDRWDAPLVNDFLCMMAFGLSRKMMEKWFGKDGLELHNQIMIGQGDIISAEPARRIADMGALIASYEGLSEEIEKHGVPALSADPKIRGAFESYISKFGDRCTEELKLESVTLDEDPALLLSAIVAASRRPSQPEGERADEALDFQKVTAGKPLKRIIARMVVTWAKHRVRDRENLRFERTRIFGRARRVFMAIGRELTALGHLNEPRDILFMTVEEILGAVEGFSLTQELRPLVAVRKAEFEAAATREDPPERITVTGAAINAGIAAGQDAALISAPSGGSGDLERSGTACSAGVTRARARVIRDPSKESLESGDILVARHTDPGWIAVFSNASAIVVERGSLLSHSAIVAREMGIPCVVALKEATRWIEDGEEITVDGATGIVTRHPS